MPQQACFIHLGENDTHPYGAPDAEGGFFY
jgi:hypothetical protein